VQGGVLPRLVTREMIHYAITPVAERRTVAFFITNTSLRTGLVEFLNKFVTNGT
jgi:hypothetical protein